MPSCLAPERAGARAGADEGTGDTMLRRIFAIWLVLVLGGCASTQPITTSDRASVTSVSVNRTIPVPPNMYYLGPGGTVGMMFGVIGALATEPIRQQDRTAFQASTTSTQTTTIDRIVYEEVLDSLRKSGKFPLKDEAEPGGAKIQVNVLMYGFSIPQGFSSKLVPILKLQCVMTDAAGRVLWSASNQTMPLGNPVEGVPADEIRNDPAKREASWRAAARALAAKIVATY